MYYWTKDVVVDPYDASQNTWYVSVFSGWGGAPNGLGGLYRTLNRGTSWTKLTASQFDRVTSITFSPTNQNEIYLTTETQGLWNSTNINSVTPTFSLVNSYPFRQPERVFFNPNNSSNVWVSSFGNGMKTGDIATGVDEMQNEKFDVEVFPNPASKEFRIKNSELRIKKIEIYNLEGKEIGNWKLEIGKSEVAIDVSEIRNGIYFLKFDAENYSVTKKLIVIK